MIFAAEWGDVSQVAIASFAANHPEPWTVLLSAFLALWSIALLAIGLGARMTRIVRPQKIQKAAAVFFAAAGLMIAFRTLRSFF
jgi:putative Ca2+/H+ antiporter (TMEM165/GDT1 family)